MVTKNDYITIEKLYQLEDKTRQVYLNFLIVIVI